MSRIRRPGGAEQVEALSVELGEQRQWFDRGQTTPEHRKICGAVNIPETGGQVFVYRCGCFHNETGDITFVAEVPNPDGVLRRGQTGTLLMKRVLKVGDLKKTAGNPNRTYTGRGSADTLAGASHADSPRVIR
jgi:hypothetical protein